MKIPEISKKATLLTLSSLIFSMAAMGCSKQPPPAPKTDSTTAQQELPKLSQNEMYMTNRPEEMDLSKVVVPDPSVDQPNTNEPQDEPVDENGEVIPRLD